MASMVASGKVVAWDGEGDRATAGRRQGPTIDGLVENRNGALEVDAAGIDGGSARTKFN